MVPIDSICVVSYLTSINHNIVSHHFKIFHWPVQGHPRSKITVPIRSSSVVSYMTSIVFNIVSLTAFEISDVQVL